jgi:HEAT repeat protein
LSQKRQRVKARLIRIGGESLIDLLEEALQDTNDTEVHLAIMEILVTLPSFERLQKTLAGYLHHPSPAVRRLAIAALGGIGDKDAIYFLSAVVRDGDESTQLLRPEDAGLACEAIAKIRERTRRL